MLTFDLFRQIVDDALGGRSAAELCRKAGLPANALSDIRRGKQPTWDRAAKIAEALDLELHIRPKGEIVNMDGLRAAAEMLAAHWVREWPREGIPVEDETLAYAAAVYKAFALEDDPVENTMADRRDRRLERFVELIEIGISIGAITKVPDAGTEDDGA